MSNRVTTFSTGLDHNNPEGENGGRNFTPVVGQPVVAAPIDAAVAAGAPAHGLRWTNERHNIFDVAVTSFLTIIMPSFVAICGVAIIFSSVKLRESGYYNECSLGD